jgi:hypothetical protein
MMLGRDMCSKYGKYMGQTNRPSIAICCNEVPAESMMQYSERTAIPESMRMQKNKCETYVAPRYIASTPCQVPGPGTTIKVYSPAPVPVGTVPASFTIELLKTQTVAATTDPTNPITRFESFFRPQPPAPPCPERLPNLDPIRETPPCVGVSRFGSSVQE